MTPTEAPPEDIEQPPEPETPEEDYGENNEDLPEQLVEALRGAILHRQQQDQYTRRREVLRDRKNRFYERGYQHIRWNNASNAGFSLISPGGLITNTAGQQVEAPNFIDDYNIFQPYLRILEAILTQNPPGIDFQPVNPNQSDDVAAADMAECYRHVFDRTNNVKKIQLELVRMLGLSGRVVLWTRNERNQKFGSEPDGSPKMNVVTTVHGTLESKLSVFASCQDKVTYCFLMDDPDTLEAKAEYPKFAKEIKGNVSGLGENAYERLARLGVLQGTRMEAQTGDAMSHLTTRTNAWLRPCEYTVETETKFGDSFVDDPTMTVGEKLEQLFPEGCRSTWVGDVYVGSEACNMDEDLVIIGGPYGGDGMFQLAMMDPLVVYQDALNDAMNAAREIFDTGWPSRWVVANETEYDAIVDQKADPYAYRQLKSIPAGTKAEDQFFEEQPPNLPATFINYIERLQGEDPQFVLASPPAVFGASMQDQKTASGYAQARAQAMGQLGLVWGVIQHGMARMYYQAALAAANNADEAKPLVVPGPGGKAISVDLAAILKGDFGCYPDEDSSFPESTAAKRQTMTSIVQIIGQSPQMAQLLDAPDNWREFLKTMGFAELIVPEAEAADQQQFEIEELLKSAPIPPEEGQVEQYQIAHATATLAGTNGVAPPYQPPPPQSSIPVRPWDFHQWHAQKCQDWLNSQDCRRELANGNVVGVQNVELHRQEHIKLIPPPPMMLPPAVPHPKPPAPAGAAKPPISAPPGAPGMATM